MQTDSSYMPRQYSNNLCWHIIIHYDCTQSPFRFQYRLLTMTTFFEIAVSSQFGFIQINTCTTRMKILPKTFLTIANIAKKQQLVFLRSCVKPGFHINRNYPVTAVSRTYGTLGHAGGSSIFNGNILFQHLG